MPAGLAQERRSSVLLLFSCCCSAEDLAWAQVANGLGGEVFTVAVVGHQGGVSQCTSFKDGSAVRRDEVEDVWRTFGVILGRLVDGAETVQELIRIS
ncbi:hypothetical protein IAR50_002904 [Cryptococcus sp. DSM 104548]